MEMKYKDGDKLLNIEGTAEIKFSNISLLQSPLISSATLAPLSFE